MSSLDHISHTLNSNSYSNSKVTKVTSSIAIEDTIIQSVSDIIDEKYRLWFITRLKAIGKNRFLEAAEKARKYGKDSKRLFSYLLKS